MPDEQLRRVTKRITVKTGTAPLVNLHQVDGELIVGDTLMVFEDEGPFMIVTAAMWSKMVGKAVRREQVAMTKDRRN